MAEAHILVGNNHRRLTLTLIKSPIDSISYMVFDFELIMET